MIRGSAKIDNSIFHQRKRKEIASGFCSIIIIKSKIKMNRMINLGFDIKLYFISGFNF